MGFRKDSYATVWETKNKGNYHEARITISRKDKVSDKYIQDFNGWVRMIGTAHTLANDLNPEDRIKLGNIDVTNNYNKETKVTYTNFLIFSFEKQDGSQTYSKIEEDDTDEPF